ncbi:MAG: hypothetical protein WA715_27030 [Candidatus Acidiferrum sp.]
MVASLGVIGWVVKAFFEGYGKKKGENLATKEDINEAVTQMKLLTRAAEEMKAETLDKSSAKERLREMRREFAFKLMSVRDAGRDSHIRHKRSTAPSWSSARRGTPQETTQRDL